MQGLLKLEEGLEVEDDDGVVRELEMMMVVEKKKVLPWRGELGEVAALGGGSLVMMKK